MLSVNPNQVLVKASPSSIERQALFVKGILREAGIPSGKEAKAIMTTASADTKNAFKALYREKALWLTSQNPLGISSLWKKRGDRGSSSNLPC